MIKQLSPMHVVPSCITGRKYLDGQSFDNKDLWCFEFNI